MLLLIPIQIITFASFMIISNQKLTDCVYEVGGLQP